MITLRSTIGYANKERKDSLIKFVSATVCGGNSFEPYCKDSQNTYWVVDSGNNWFVHFPPEEPMTFRLSYRYPRAEGNPELLLANWLCFRGTGLSIVE